jgi:ferric-dicitrate binding protein FerR (iron transport regulator)
VRLNGGTRIVYLTLFGDQRRVEVDGEAYFEVEHDARRPFVVVTGEVSSTVLGTTFNVHAYSEDEDYQITLATGSLLVDGGRESRSVRRAGILRTHLRDVVAAPGECRSCTFVAGG